MRPSEEIFTEIVSLKDKEDLDLPAAVVLYAEKADCEVEEVLKMLDASAIVQIKDALSNSIALRPSLRRRSAPLEIDFG